MWANVAARTARPHVPSVEAWKAQAAPDRVIRSHSVLPSTSKELQSSEVPLVTTVTAVGLSCGEYSKQSLAQSRSAACSSSTPASYMLANSTLTCAARVKSPAGGRPVLRPGRVDEQVRVRRRGQRQHPAPDPASGRRAALRLKRERQARQLQRGHPRSLPRLVRLRPCLITSACRSRTWRSPSTSTSAPSPRSGSTK